ncbi:hypothetical protein [Paraburkholderia diazotrophica]|uniref:hypothetical protein n=1 Tax=Paraburkholderia diazotrophica TaxID=667676 RepID=UPI003180699C
MVDDEPDLLRANRHIRDAIRLIREQQKRIASFDERNALREVSEELLAVLIDSLRLAIEHRRVIRREISVNRRSKRSGR